MNKVLKFALPVVFLISAVAVWVLLFAFKPEVVHRPIDIKHPMVSVAEVTAQSMSIPIMTRGSVTPGTEIHLTSEVGGQVLEVSPNLASGGFFRKGETLVRIDTLEYDVNIKRAEASVAQARQSMAQAEAEKNARSRVQGGNRSQLATYEIQYRQAVANFEAASAELQAAKMQRSRTVIKAPFDGRVRMASVDVGQYARPGMQLAVIYAVDVAEIRLPLSDRQLALVNVPMSFSAEETPPTPVRISSEFGGRRYHWDGQVVRAEGGLDERNRLLYVVAQIEDPYEIDPLQPGRPPLTSGFFVEATIQGRYFDNVVAVPRRALRNSAQVWTVDADNRLARRNVDVIYKGKETIYVSSGLQSGDRVVLSQLDIAVEGMQVRASLETDAIDVRQDQGILSATTRTGGGSATQPAASQRPAAGAGSHTQQFSREELLSMARDAKQQYDQLDAAGKQQVQELVDDAKQLAERAARSTTAAAPAVSGTPSASNAPAAATPDSDTRASAAQSAAQAQKPPTGERAMSPLASLIEDDVQAPASTPTPAQSAQPAPARVTGGNVVSAAQAPQPLREALQ